MFPLWQEQDIFGGINNNTTSLAFGNSFTTYGVVVNNGTSGSSFLNTINPGTTAVNSASKVLVTDGSGNITWILQTALPGGSGGGGSVTSVGTSDGLTVGGVPGGTITTTGTIGLNGWTITQSGSSPYILLPQTTSTVVQLGGTTYNTAVTGVNTSSLTLYGTC